MATIGKLLTAVESAASPAATKIDCRKYRLFVKDKQTGVRFLVDSGADVSLIPANIKAEQPCSYVLYAANGTQIPTYGIKTLTLDLGLRRAFQWPFIVAKVSKGIIGADFLHQFHLLIDIHKQKLIDGITQLSVKSEILTISDEYRISTFDRASQFSDLLNLYPDITKPNILNKSVKHDVKHYIQTKGQPVHSRARQLNPEKLALAKQEFQFMLANNIIRPSKSQWASPLHLVNKKDGTLRPCGDYRKLNDQTIPDRYPIPRIEDFHLILKDKVIFSKIDLIKAYYQIPIAEEDKPKTAIITPFGLYEFNVMSFGLRNAPATFQRFINEVFYGLDFLFPYLDDVLVASGSEAEHKEHLKIVFERLNNYGLRINVSKSIMGVDQVEFLGYFITAKGSSPLPAKVQVILDYKLPETLHDLRTFLGMVNFYRRYLKNAAKTQALLHEMLKGAKKKDRRKVPWTDESIQQFEKCKTDLANAALLCFPKPGLPLSLCTDASDWAIGSVLEQFEDDMWKPIAFYSKKLNETQKGYSTYDRELLGIYLSIKHFKYLLEGREFTVWTDHKPLIFAFKQKNEKASPRQLRQLQYISEFTTDIQHLSGKDNVVADTLSRIETVSVVDYDQIAHEQSNDTEFQKLCSSDTSLDFKPYTLASGKTLWCDISHSKIRPYIPPKFRKEVFNQIHGLSHPGIKSTIKEMTARFIWPGINKEVKEWAQTCINCQKTKVNRHTKSQFSSYQEPDERFNVVHIDLIGPLPPSNGQIYCLTCIDRFTCWTEVVPLPEISAETVSKAFYEHWICRFGAPGTIITDQGRQFKSQLLTNLANICGAKLRTSTPYHPQCQGKVERFHRTLKTAIKAHNNARWTEILPTVLLGLRSVIKSGTNHSVAQMVYGTNIRLPAEFFDEPTVHIDPDTFVTNLQSYMSQLKPMPSKQATQNTIFVHKNLSSCSHVFLRVDRVKKPLEPSYQGPFLVVKKFDKYFTLSMKDKHINISIDRLKPAYMLTCDNTPELLCNNNTNDQSMNSHTPQVIPDEKTSATTRCGRRINMPVRFKD